MSYPAINKTIVSSHFRGLVVKSEKPLSAKLFGREIELAKTDLPIATRFSDIRRKPYGILYAMESMSSICHDRINGIAIRYKKRSHLD